MKKANLYRKTKKKFKATTTSNYKLPIAPNRLQRDFIAEKPSEKCVGDISYVWTNEGWMYLAAVIFGKVLTHHVELAAFQLNIGDNLENHLFYVSYRDF